MATNKNLKEKLQRKAGNSSEDKSPKSIGEWIKSNEKHMQKLLPKDMDIEEIEGIITEIISENPDLSSCNVISLIDGVIQGLDLGLNTKGLMGQVYMVPCNGEVELHIGYRGIINLAYRGSLKDLYARTVYSNDDFEINYGLNQHIKHNPNLEHRGEPIGYYAVYHLKNGACGFDFMSKREVENHIAMKFKGRNNKYNPWVEDFDSMAKKAVIKRALKYAPIDGELAKGIMVDETVVRKIHEDIRITAEVEENASEDKCEEEKEVEYVPAES